MLHLTGLPRVRLLTPTGESRGNLCVYIKRDEANLLSRCSMGSSKACPMGRSWAKSLCTNPLCIGASSYPTRSSGDFRRGVPVVLRQRFSFGPTSDRSVTRKVLLYPEGRLFFKKLWQVASSQSKYPFDVWGRNVRTPGFAICLGLLESNPRAGGIGSARGRV